MDVQRELTDVATTGRWGGTTPSTLLDLPSVGTYGIPEKLAGFAVVDADSVSVAGVFRTPESESTTFNDFSEQVHRWVFPFSGQQDARRSAANLAIDTCFRQFLTEIVAPAAPARHPNLVALDNLKRSLGGYPPARIVERLTTTGVTRHAASVASALRRYFATQEISIGDGSSGYVVCLTVSDPRSVTDSYEDLNRFLFDWWAVQDSTVREKVEVALA